MISNATTFPLKLEYSYGIGQICEMAAGLPVSTAGDTTIQITTISSLGDAKDGSLTFCDIPGKRAAALIEQARGAVVITDADVAPIHQCLIYCANPRLLFARILDKIFPRVVSSMIDPSATVSSEAELGARVTIGPHAMIGPNVRIGDDTVVGARTRIDAGTLIGERCWIGDNCALGIDGTSYVTQPDGSWQRLPHLGRVILGSDVELGHGVLVIHGILQDTHVGDNVCIGNYSTVGHNCSIGRSCWIAVNATLCGSVSLGEGVQVGVGARILNHLHVGNRAKIGIGSVVLRNVGDGMSVFGNPAKPTPMSGAN